MEYDLVQSPARLGYRSNDALAEDRNLYAMLMKKTYYNVNIVVRDGETAVGLGSLELLGTSILSVLGDGQMVLL